MGFRQKGVAVFQCEAVRSRQSLAKGASLLNWSRIPSRRYLLVLLLPVLAACQENKAQTQPTESPKVVVTQASTETVPLTLTLTGRTETPNAVQILARVDGHIETRPFTEGADVKQGDTLFVIDQRPYKSELARVQGEQVQNAATLVFANKEVERYTVLAKDGTEPPEKLDEKTAEANEAQGALDSSKAEVETAQINLDFTTVQAPVDGRVGRVYKDVGNLVTAGETLLVELQQMDPLYVYISPSETQFLSLEQHRAKNPDLPVTVELIDGTKHPHPGKLDFTSPSVDPSTGTIAIRAAFPNTERTLRPGQYASVSITLAEQPGLVTVPAEAIGQDQAGFFVFVVDKDSKVESRRITRGQLYEGRRVVEKGLEAGETVIVEGLQKVKSGMAVRAETKQSTQKADG